MCSTLQFLDVKVYLVFNFYVLMPFGYTNYFFYTNYFTPTISFISLLTYNLFYWCYIPDDLERFSGRKKRKRARKGGRGGEKRREKLKGWAFLITAMGLWMLLVTFRSWGEARERSFLEAPERLWPCWRFDFELLDSKTEIINLCCVKHPSLWYFVASALAN